jgi:hypothetical protein
MTQTQAPTFAPTLTPRGEAATAGPWELVVTDVQAGDAAWATIASANAGNDAAPAGTAWVLAYVVATNRSDRAAVINLTDFAGTGTDGVLRRTPAMIAPDPAIQGAAEPGTAVEGWVPFLVNDTSSVLLWFNSPFLGGDWANAWFALTDGAAIPSFEPVADDPAAGLSPDAPAAFGATVRAGDFDVALVDHISGQAVYDIADFGLRALAGSGSTETWHAFFVRATNISDRPAFFSYTALRVTDTTGEPWDHLMALTPPQPDAAREIMPGATREGWAAIELMPWASLDLMRIQPSTVTDEPRYITFSGDPVAADPTPEPVQDLAEGDVVELSDTPVNLRADASVNGEIVAELDGSSTLTVTGDKVEADGYTWYPVTVDNTGDSGFVVANYLTPSTVD